MDAHTAAGEIARFGAVRCVRVSADWGASEPTVWAHRVTDEDESEPLAVTVERDPAAPRSVSIALDV